MMEQKEKRDYKAVYTVVERGEGRKDVWIRLGAAFTNRDGSLTVLLDAVPTNGRLHIRDKSEDHRSSPLGLVRFHGREDVTGAR